MSVPKWYHNPWFVIFMLFFVLGPLGLPLLWRSSAFTKQAKLGWTGVMGIYTAALIALTVKLVFIVMQYFKNLEAIIYA